MDLNGIWFVLVGVLIAGYGILDGFDFGVGALSLFARGPDERRVHMDAIAPVWDGNEVWLLTGGGALFAAFPVVYATVFSGFYLALMLLLLFLILRAVSLELRGKVDSDGWRRAFDLAFGLGSLVPPILFGVAVGNILRGLPIDEAGTYTGTFLGLLNPYAILIGVLALFMALTLGGLYLGLKTEGDLQARMGRWVPRLWIGWVVLWLGATIATFATSPHLFGAVLKEWVFFVLLVLALAGLLAIPVAVKAGRWGWGFLAAAAAMGGQVGLAGVSLYPWLVPSRTGLLFSLDVYNASSTPRTLTVMLVIAGVGVPIVLLYTVLVYRAFKGKVTPGEGY